MTDPYAYCTCGSGKKFKGCCQPISPGIEQALGLEVGQDVLADEVLGQLRRLRAGVAGEELADHLIELAAVQEVAAAQVPDEPFASAEVGRQHNVCIL